MISIEVFDDIAENIGSVLVYMRVIYESFLSVIETDCVLCFIRAADGVIDDPDV